PRSRCSDRYGASWLSVPQSRAPSLRRTAQTKLRFLPSVEEAAQLRPQFAIACAADVVALQAADEAVGGVVGEAVAMPQLAARVVLVSDALVEPRPQRRASPHVEAVAHRRGEHDPLVDLGLHLELEVRGLAVRARALDDVHEVTDALDDLAERVGAGLA